MQLQHTEFLRTEQNKRLRHARQVRQQYSQALRQFRFGLPTAGNGIDRVGLGTITAQELSGEVAVDGERGAKPRHAPQRTIIKRFIPEVQALYHAPDGFRIGGQMMTEGRDGGVLMMGIAGHNAVDVEMRHVDQRLHQPQA